MSLTVQENGNMTKSLLLLLLLLLYEQGSQTSVYLIIDMLRVGERMALLPVGPLWSKIPI